MADQNSPDGAVGDATPDDIALTKRLRKASHNLTCELCGTEDAFLPYRSPNGLVTSLVMFNNDRATMDEVLKFTLLVCITCGNSKVVMPNILEQWLAESEATSQPGGGGEDE